MPKATSTKSASVIKEHAPRRIQQLADENRQLRQYVAEIMARLRENDRLFSRMFELEGSVLAASDPEALCFALLRGLRSGFELDMVRLWFDRSSFMGGREMQEISERDLVWVEEGEIINMGLNKEHVWLMQLTPDKGFDWLEERDHHLGSIALLVLGDPARPFGVLGMGSVDAARFGPTQSADFLQHLTQVISLSLENAISRERLARLSITDALTGSHNRRFLQPHSHQPLSKWFGTGVGVTCLYVDVDAFKNINDRYGHEAGDDVLNGVSQAMRDMVRMQDPLIRMGGDEFTLLLPGCSSEKAGNVGDKILQACARIKSGEDSVSVSMGLACSPPEKDLRVKDLISMADQAMYVAKALGGGRLEMAEDSMT